MLIEVLGLPGSGKTTLIKQVLPQLRSLGRRSRRADKLAGLPCEAPEALRYLSRSPDRAALYRAQAFRQAYPALMDHIERRLTSDLTEQFLFTLIGSHYQAYTEHADNFDFVFLDEGFAHRGVSAHLDQEDAVFADFMKLVPVPDLVIHLSPPPRVAFRRAISRHEGQEETKVRVTEKLGNHAVFRHRQRLLEASLDILSKRGAKVVSFNTADPMEVCRDIIVTEVQAAHSSQETSPQAAE